MYSPELQNQIAVWRRKSVEGTLTREEMREVVQAIRQGRTSAAAASKPSKARSTKPVRDSEEMLKGLLG